MLWHFNGKEKEQGVGGNETEITARGIEGLNEGRGGVAGLGSPVAPPGGAACVAAG